MNRTDALVARVFNPRLSRFPRVGGTGWKPVLQVALLLLSSQLIGCAMSSSTTPKLAPTALRCEYKIDPLGIDQTTPRFDWQLKSDQANARDQKQSAYQVLVASNEDNLNNNRGDLWDSGVVKSDATAQINYGGEALKSEQQALWK